MDISKINAVILAAGRSSRQNGFKPLLPIGPKTAIEHCINLFSAMGLSRVYVVVGHRADELMPVVSSAGAHTVVNTDYGQGMFSSVQAGVSKLPESMAGFFVLPADIPLVRRVSLEFLISAFEKNPDTAVFLPEFYGRTGHPPLIRTDLRARIASHDGTNGLRGVFDPETTMRVTVPDRFILEDIDTPGQYQKILDLWQNHGIPSLEEASILLDYQCRSLPEVAAHCRTVAQVAGKLADAVNQRPGPRVNRDLTVSAALLHDIARNQPKHCQAGAGLLKALGYSTRLADIVARHADYDPPQGEPVNETELVYLADKLVSKTRMVSIDERFGARYDQFKHEPEARQAVMRKWKQATAICDRIQKAMGVGLSELL